MADDKEIRIYQQKSPEFNELDKEILPKGPNDQEEQKNMVLEEEKEKLDEAIKNEPWQDNLIASDISSEPEVI